MSSGETLLLLRLRIKVVGIDSRRRRRTFCERAKRNPVAQAPTEVEPLRSWGSRHGREQGHGRRRAPGFLHGRRRSDGEGQAHFRLKVESINRQSPAAKRNRRARKSEPSE